MENFLKGSGAIMIGLALAFTATFPIAVIGAILGWFYIDQTQGEE